tara:strand:- start:309 stop:1046 length:738 start_codon:yes stop_codon:yes gene_type:complete
MCTVLAFSIGMGAASAVSGINEQNRQHRAQVDAVNRSNQMARQKYLNDITISAYNDQRKGEVFTAQLQADAAARTAYYQQKEINQIEHSRASEAAQAELREKVTKTMFESQQNLAKAIQAQGELLTSGMQAGQSTLLTVDDVERKFGMEAAQLDASIFDATRAYGIKQFGIDLDAYAADTQAHNSITTSAHVAPTASFMTQRPIEQKAPPKPSPLGPILGGISTAFSTGTSLGGEGFWKDEVFNR